ncbi:MAG: SusC/RagA family TonB-linked outer membrane protein, partial [Chitinophagaceae bacterium]
VSDYHFLYNQSLISNKPKVNIDVRDADITTVLGILLSNTGISYRLMENNLVVLKEEQTGQLSSPDIRITGKVTGTANEPLVGVSVTVKGTSVGTTTDANGNYALSVPDEGAVLVFSYVGFNSQEVPVNNRTSINVTLSTSTAELNTVVVVGYGTQRKIDVTGSVSQIKGEEIAKQSVVNPISGLQGKVAGLQITNSGAPGSSPQIRIRGVGTVYGNANPLYIVDGVWFDDISFLNPNDIENISVLKDASSEAIYGIRAANGVILITTKKGRNNVSGGSEKSTYNLSLGYLLQDGIVEKNRFERYTAKLQNDFQVASPLRVGYTITGSMNKSTDIPGSIFHQLYSAAPIVPVYYADGTYGDPNDFTVTSSANFNPQVTLDVFNQKSKNYRLTGSIYADLKFARHFTFHTNIGGDYGQNEARNYSSIYTATLVQRNSISRLSLTNGATRNWILENTLTYENRFGNHSIRILAGQGAQSYQYRQSTSSAENVPNNSEGDYYVTLGNNRNVTDFGSLSRVSSYFGRANYSFQNKYLLTATIRADGSSKFSGDNRWGYFPSVGLGWILTEENFMKSQSLFNSLKLRGSWGKIGNMSVPANLSVLKVSQTPQFIYVGGNGTTATGASINTIVPPATFWEKGVGTDIGLEASLLHNRLSAEVTFYNRKTENAIFDIPILGSLGTSGSTITGNQATFQNRGVELVL